MKFGAISTLDFSTLAVMPWITVGGPMALLALLFPATCGGMMLCMRRWRVVLTVLSLNSTIYLLHAWFYAYLFDSWWESRFELWFFMTVLAVVALLLERQPRRELGGSVAIVEKTDDVMFLGVAIAVSALIFGYGRIYRMSWISDYSSPCLLLGIAATIGLFHALLLRSNGSNMDAPLLSISERQPACPPLFHQSARGDIANDQTSDDVTNWAGNRNCALPKFEERTWQTPQVVLLAFCICGLFCTVNVGIRLVQADSFQVKWKFAPGRQGAIHSSPLIVGDRIYAAFALDSPATGELYCLNRQTGDVLWVFNDDGEMKPGISSPVHANGRIFIGEGFHQAVRCKLYCLSAIDGTKIWDFETTSHTESTPTIVDGRVYFGAGDDGLYCLDSETGKEVWHFAGPHVDGCPAVAGNRVFAGSGYGTREVFCVDASNGVPIWRVPTDGASFGSPTLADGMVFFGVGSWGPLDDGQKPFGAVLCLDALTGNKNWRYDVGKTAHTTAALVGDRLVFVAEDECHCVNITSGKACWKRTSGASYCAAPVVSGDLDRTIWVARIDGLVSCLDLRTSVETHSFNTHDYGAIRPAINSKLCVMSSFSMTRIGHQVCMGVEMRTLSSCPALICFE